MAPQAYENQDPIMDTPIREKHKSEPDSGLVYDSADDDGDEIFDDETVGHITQPTLPLAQPYLPKAAAPSSPTQYTTQPTQVLTPTARRHGMPVVQVAASSPTSQRQHMSPSPAAQRSLGNIMAPPGTKFRRPIAIPAPAPAAIEFSSDPPIDVDSSEDDAAMSRSNIRPTAFSSSVRESGCVEDTPKKQAFPIDLGSFAYNPQRPQKRPAEETSTTGADSRKRTKPHQTGPSKAQPVQPDIELEDIEDLGVRQKVNKIRMIFPSATNMECQQALAAKKGNLDDALSLLADQADERTNGNLPIVLSDDDEIAPPASVARPVAPSKPAAKRQVQAPAKSIRDKYSSTQAAKPRPAPSAAVVHPAANTPKPRRRLVKGRKNPSSPAAPSPDTTDSVSSHFRRQAVITVDSDESESAVDSGADDDDGESSEGTEHRLLKFLNTCSANDLADLANEKVEVAERIISKRPFKSLDQVRRVDKETASKPGPKKRGPASKRTMGDRVVDICEEMFIGYDAVDELVAHCEAFGKPIKEEMNRWGANVQSAGGDGELSLTNLDETKSESSPSSKMDSGIGTPSSAMGRIDLDGDDVVRSGSMARAKSGFLGKPRIMAEDLVLKDYQLVGLNWMNLLWSKRLSCILADDMGLGKTCQVITFLSHLYETGVSGPHLIVVPGSTLENWLREFQRFSPNLTVEPYYGAQKERYEQRITIEENLTSINVIITTYDNATKAEDNKFLRKVVKPVVCVYDEGHYLRNSSTKRYQELMKIPADFRLLLSGTPLQNNLQELVSLLAFLMPSMFAEHSEHLGFVFKHKAKTTDADHAALLSAQRIQRARTMMTPFILRRKKHQVLRHLPAKHSRVEYCELSPPQKAIYDELLAQQRKVMEDRAAGRSTKDSANVLMRLRQSAIHHLLFRRIYDDKMIRKMSKIAVRDPEIPGDNEEYVYEDISFHSDYQAHQLSLKYPALNKFALQHDEWMDSGKVQKLVELLLRFKENGDRTLIFSQFTTVMDILEAVMETLNMQFFRMDGSTPIPERQDMLDEFYNDPNIPVFMLSTKSGGAGINLACANKVIIFDSSFNPQDDVQAENRAHRVGQVREVEVIRLVTRGTIEEQIHALGNSKLALDERVAGEAAQPGDKTETAGIQAVERMLYEQIKGAGTGGKAQEDLKDQFKDGLTAAGVELVE